jgi:hypothetical protein
VSPRPQAPRTLPFARAGTLADRLMKAEMTGPPGASAKLARDIAADPEEAAQVMRVLARACGRLGYELAKD